MPSTHLETILFVGAGATQQLAMPPTGEIAKFLWDICDEESLEVTTIEKAKCFEWRGKDVALLMFVLDGGADGNNPIGLGDERWKQAFPGVQKEDVEKLVRSLRRHYTTAARTYSSCRCSCMR